MCWITACRSSRFLPETLSSSPWMVTCTLNFPSLISLTRRLASSLVDALANERLLPHGLASRLFQRLIVDHADVDFAAGEMALQKLMHLLELELVVGVERDLGPVSLDA